MAPPRRILRQQLEILIDYLEENKDLSKGLIPGTPMSQQAMRQKWTSLGKTLNAVPDGAMKTPDGWKKYWFEWRHKCRKKAANARRYQSGSDGGPNRFVPLNDLEVRVLDLSGKGSVSASVTSSKPQDSFLDDDSDSEQTKVRSTPASTKIKQSIIERSRIATDDEAPPRWALQLEERRIAAEERMAEALESMAAIMRLQEERRGMLEERVADALTAIAGTVQDLNSGLQEAIQNFQRIESAQSNGPDIKEDVFL